MLDGEHDFLVLQIAKKKKKNVGDFIALLTNFDVFFFVLKFSCLSRN